MANAAARAGLKPGGVRGPRAMRLGNPRKVASRFAFTCADVVRVMGLFSFAHEKARAGALMRTLVVDHHALMAVHEAASAASVSETHFQPFPFQESRELVTAARDAARAAKRAERLGIVGGDAVVPSALHLLDEPGTGDGSESDSSTDDDDGPGGLGPREQEDSGSSTQMH